MTQGGATVTARAQATYFVSLLGFWLGFFVEISVGFLVGILGCVREAGKARACMGFGFRSRGWESTGALGARDCAHKGRVFPGTGFCTQPLFFVNYIVGHKVLPCSREVFLFRFALPPPPRRRASPASSRLPRLACLVAPRPVCLVSPASSRPPASPASSRLPRPACLAAPAVLRLPRRNTLSLSFAVSIPRRYNLRSAGIHLSCDSLRGFHATSGVDW